MNECVNHLHLTSDR